MAEQTHWYLGLVVYLVFCGCTWLSEASKNDEFYEELYIKPFQSGHMYFDFQFTTKWNVSVHDAEKFQHYRLFPKSLGEMLAAYHVQELHLTQAQGRWRHQSWGYPVEEAPSGAQLWVWFKPHVAKLDCPLCSGQKNFTMPIIIPCPFTSGPYVLFVAQNGVWALAQTMSPHHTFQELPIRKKEDSTCSTEAVELIQSLKLVVDPVFSNKGYQNWSIRKVFGLPLTSHCPLASRSQVFVDMSTNEFSLTPNPSEERTMRDKQGEKKLAVYNVASVVAERKAVNIGATYNAKQEYGSPTSPPVYAHRYITGYGLVKGGVSCLIYNTLNTTLPIFYMDTLPWFTRLFFKSISVESKGIPVPYKVHYIPGKDRERPYCLEMAFTLPPRSVTKVSLEFERAFLKWTEYPPDANHGFYINSAVISLNLPSDGTFIAPAPNTSTLLQLLSDESPTRFLRVYTESLLVSLPTPDFSMPYNVICLACTVVAIAFGSIHNLTTRRFVLLDPTKSKGLIAKVKASLQRFRKQKNKAQNAELSKDTSGKIESEAETNEILSEDSKQAKEKLRQRKQ